jgi:hypothetical protein
MSLAFRSDRSSGFSRSALWALAFVLLWVTAPLVARDPASFAPSLPAGTRCRVAVDQVHPTQFAVGYWEVEQRAASIAQKKPKKLQAYLQEHLALLVVGPGDVPYLVDGHHLCMAMLKSGRGNTVEARVEANWRDLSKDEFWKKMREGNWVYPYDHQGRGPLDVAKLPAKVTDLTDDAYRSLAWAVRERGGYRKTLISFAEFKWANFFRSRVKIGNQPGDFDRAVESALRLYHTSEAKDMPGYAPE